MTLKPIIAVQPVRRAWHSLSPDGRKLMLNKASVASWQAWSSPLFQMQQSFMLQNICRPFCNIKLCVFYYLMKILVFSFSALLVFSIFRSQVAHTRSKRQTSGLLDCGGNYTAPTGYFHTPGFPIAYLNNQVCEWHIKVPPPYVKIKLQFVPILSLHSTPVINGTRYCFDMVTVSTTLTKECRIKFKTIF